MAARVKRWLGAILAVSLLAAVACNHTPTSVQVQHGFSVAFAPEYGGQAASIALVPGSPNPDFDLTLDLDAEQVVNFRGVFFDLKYPSDILQYAGFKGGSFLSRVDQFGSTSGDPIAGVGEPPGQSILRVSIFDHHTELPAWNGSGTMMTIYFNAKAPGTGNLSFQGYGTYDPATLAQQWGNLSWFGGGVTVSQVRMR